MGRPTKAELIAQDPSTFLAIKPNKVFDDDAKKKFLETYAQTGRVMYSAAMAGVHESTVRRHRKDDEEFAMVYDIAHKWHVESFDAEIERRGKHGWDEGVYQKGERVMETKFDPDTGLPMIDKDGKKIMVPAVIRRYSDRMLELGAKRWNPEYRDKQEIDVNVTGGVLAIPMAAAPGKADTPDDWADKYGGEAVDAEFERVVPEPDAPLAQIDAAPPEHQEPCVAVECHVCRPTDTEPKEPKDTRKIRRGY